MRGPLQTVIPYLNFLFHARAEHLDSVTLGKLYHTAVGYLAQFLWLSIMKRVKLRLC